MNDLKYIEVGKAYLAYLKALNRAEFSSTELSEAIENIRSDSLYTFSEDDVDHLEDIFEVFLKNTEEVKKASKDLRELVKLASLP